MGKKILLVGGCGFIGHNLALHLSKIGHSPVIVDSLSINNIYSLDNKEILNQKALIYEEIIQKALKINAVCIGSIKEQVSNDLIKITVSFFKKNEW